MISNFISRQRSTMGHKLSLPLLELLTDQRPDVRRQAIELLGWCKSAASQAMASIANSIVFDDDWGVKLAALNALLEIAQNQWQPFWLR